MKMSRLKIFLNLITEHVDFNTTLFSWGSNQPDLLKKDFPKVRE